MSILRIFAVIAITSGILLFSFFSFNPFLYLNITKSGTDKISHIVGYGLLYISLFGLQCPYQKKLCQRKLLIIAFICILFGLVIEFVQKEFTSGVRFFEITDIYANIAGILIGYVIALIILKIKKNNTIQSFSFKKKNL